LRYGLCKYNLLDSIIITPFDSSSHWYKAQRHYPVG
jgi:hypothetical protein